MKPTCDSLLQALIGSAALAAALSAATPPAHANIVTAAWNPNSWTYEIKHVPDFDQRRSAAPGVPGLPNNGGMYCVPTSTVNLMAYAANHGFPVLAPGDKAWWAYNNATLYNDATSAISIMGVLMDTDPSGGTGGGDAEDGAQAWLGGFQFIFDVDFSWFGSGLAPTGTNLGLLACGGALTNFCYGFYSQTGNVGGIPIVKRSGGHCVSFVKGSWTGGNSTSAQGVFYVRDPADASTDSVQLAYVNRKLYATNELVIVDAFPNFRVMTRVKGDPSDTSFRFIDGILKIKPKFGLSWKPDVQPPVIKFAFPTKLLGGAGATNLPSVQINPAWVIKDVQFTALEDSALVLAQADGFVVVGAVNPITGETEVIAELDEGSSMVQAPNGFIYVAGPEGLFCLNPAIDDTVVSEVVPPFPPKALAYDHAGKKLAGIATTAKMFMLWNAASFTAPPMVLNLPTSVPSAGEARLAQDPTDGSWWINTDAAPGRLFKVEVQGAAAPMLVNTGVLDVACTVQSLGVDEMGQLIVSCDGSVKVFQKVVGGPYVENPDSPLHGLQVDGPFRSTISTTNYDPDLHDNEAFNNIFPEDLDEPGEGEIDCLTDLNGDRVTDSQDLNILLAAFGTGYEGDTDADADTDSFDLNMLLAAFGEDCPEME